ncbi:hypothetical protein LJC58_05225 [Lachnospiraceae bacterium OttesenSCG-928-D06]|nr:hypothetical protein [Lachnospiraceae bacterium OttesenSCG-928-D06]
MKKGIIITVLGLVAVIFIILFSSKYLFSSQYNDNGMSRGIHFEIDETVGTEFICSNDGYEVYTINIKNIYFQNAKAENIDIKDALSNESVEIQDMIYGLKKSTTLSGFTCYIAENYQLILIENRCVIAPLTLDENILLAVDFSHKIGE